MKYQDRKTKVIIVMITVSLAGLMAVQLALLSIAWELKDQAFKRNVINALTLSAQKLERGEITEHALDVIYRIGLTDSLHSQLDSFAFHSPGRKFPLSHQVLLDTTFVSIETTMPDGMTENPAWASLDSLSESRKLTFILADGRTQLIQQIVGNLVVQPPRPIRERLNRSEIDSLLRANLDAVGIDLVPDFCVLAAGGDSVILSSSNGYPNPDLGNIKKSGFRSRLFPLDLTSEGFEIVLHFPGQRSFLLKQIWPLLAASVVFIAVIIVAFILTLGTAQQQRRFADRIVDFINNMTHEFKTPISTVALASEAIARPDILEQPEALQRYNRMIRDENQRMRHQVERILQIAQLETGDFQLNLASVHMHELARGSTENFALQIEKRGGNLSLDLAAEKAFVRGDPVHLTNVLANVLDNAIKYSPESPVIGLATYNQDDFLVLEVSDQGIGIQRADRELVFEKYYRCPTGDRHDVKGFGLGLSYVRLLVEAHGGYIRLAGAPGGGTRLVLGLPLDSAEHQPGGGK